jgi:hypothetical protein
MGNCFSCHFKMVKNAIPVINVKTNAPNTTQRELVSIEIHRDVSREKSIPTEMRESVILSHTSISIPHTIRGRSSRLEDVITPKIIDDIYHRPSIYYRS